MNEQEQRDLAKQLAEGSEVLDFEKALLGVRHRPEGAKKILRMREEHARSREERARQLERLRRARIEEFG